MWASFEDVDEYVSDGFFASKDCESIKAVSHRAGNHRKHRWEDYRLWPGGVLTFFTMDEKPHDSIDLAENVECKVCGLVYPCRTIHPLSIRRAASKLEINQIQVTDPGDEPWTYPRPNPLWLSPELESQFLSRIIAPCKACSIRTFSWKRIETIDRKIKALKHEKTTLLRAANKATRRVGEVKFFQMMNAQNQIKKHYETTTN